MVRLIGEALEYDIANTIIDDSEPERVAEEKESRRNRRKQKQQRRQTQENRDNTNDIVRNNPKIPPPGDTALGQTSTKEFDNHSEACVERHPDINAAPDGSSPTSHPIDLCIQLRDPSDSEITDFKQSLSRFMLSKPPTVTSKQTSTNISLSQKVTRATTQDDMKNKVQKSSAEFSLLSALLTKEQLSKLNKCYVCDLAWTSRKIIPMKLTHIRSCAKKRGWSEETIVHVFKKELDIVDIPESRSLPDSVVLPQKADSLLKDIGGTALRKQVKGRPQKVNILDPTQAHSAIVERAKTLFGPSIPSSGRSNECTSCLPSTQPFRPSKFGSVSKGVFANAMLEENEERGISPTQNVGPSKPHQSKFDPLASNASSIPVFCSPSTSSQSTLSPCTGSVSMPNSKNAGFLTTSKKVIDKISCQLDAMQLVTTPKLDHPHKAPYVYVSDSTTTIPFHSTICHPPAEKTRNIVNSSPIEPHCEQHTNDIDEQLVQVIKQNHVLYERILRYEPLHFDMFLNLDGIKDMNNNRGFKNRLRASLDIHGINFYTDSALGSNRRRW